MCFQFCSPVARMGGLWSREPQQIGDIKVRRDNWNFIPSS